MGKLYTPSPISNIYSSVNQINQNWDDISDALDNTLARLDVESNQMETDLDLNSNDLLNVRNIVLDSTLLEPKEISGTYTLEKDDLYRVLICTAQTEIIIPADIDNQFKSGWYCHVLKDTDQTVIFFEDVGLTVKAVDNSREILEQEGWCTVYCLLQGSTWALMGNLA